MTNTGSFDKDGYVLIKDALSKDICNIAEAYFLIREKRASMYGTDINEGFGDSQSPGQFLSYADSLGETILLKLRSKIEEATGLSLYPTNSFCRIYRNGSILKKHVDRGSCEISASLFIGFNYSKKDFSWPLFIEGNAIDMQVGDMVVYRGLDLEHWREDLEYQEDFYHIQIFLHYVDANGPYTDLVFDRRKSVYHLEKINEEEEAH